MKEFNVTGLCVPHMHYMADMSAKITQIKSLVKKGRYFTINRARQYGKTTTLYILKKELSDEYLPIYISFEGIGDEAFESAEKFCLTFLEKISIALQFSSALDDYRKRWIDDTVIDFIKLDQHITKMCKDKKVVLMIDEVDKTSNNRVFLYFIGMLRSKFLARQAGEDSTFHSVILAGVYDIKNIKLKILNESATPHASQSSQSEMKAAEQSVIENRIYNSPWNIAVSFGVDMSFNPAEISVMLKEYEADHDIGMDIASISDEVYKYTDGYPFLVSRVCQCIDEELNKNWMVSGIQKAVNKVAREKNMLLDDLFKNLENNKAIYDFMYDILIVGRKRPFVISDPVIELCNMYGYIKSSDEGDPANCAGHAKISNKIFEIAMCNHFASKDANSINTENAVSSGLMQDVFKNGTFDMELALRKFAEHYYEVYADKDAPFLERHGRLLFLSFLKPLINGRGFYHIESQFTDMRRMDIIIDFSGEQFIIELKIWHGQQYKQEAYKQLAGYLTRKSINAGYLLTFDFRKNVNKQISAEWVEYDGKRIFDVVI